MRRVLAAFRRDTRGATVIEYAMIAGLLSILIVSGVARIGTTLNTKYLAPVANATS